MAGTTGLISAGNPVTYLGSIVLSGYVLESRPVVQAPRRVIDKWVVCAIHTGAGRYVDDAGCERELGPGSVLVIRPGLPHWYGTHGGATWTETWAILEGPLVDVIEPRVRAAGAVHRARGEAIAILASLLRRQPRGEREVEQQLTELFGWLVDVVSTTDTVRSIAIQTAMDVLSADVAGELSMNDVAARIGLDYDVFRHAFAREVGRPPSAFRNDRRIQAAANLLRMTTMTHRAIARELGYTDEFHLSRRFRAAFGVSPSAYRHSRSAD